MKEGEKKKTSACVNFLLNVAYNAVGMYSLFPCYQFQSSGFQTLYSLLQPFIPPKELTIYQRVN